MTVVAANLKQMACDSLVAAGGGVDFPTPKIYRAHDSLIGFAGEMSAVSVFLSWYFAGRNPAAIPVPPHHMADFGDFEVLELNEAGILLWSNSFHPVPVKTGMYAIGAGGQAAQAAMLLGRSPAEACQVAIDVVPSCCAGPVQVHDLVEPAPPVKRRRKAVPNG